MKPETLYDIPAEEAVIASLVIDGSLIEKVEPILSSGDFYRDSNRWCYEACLALHRRGEEINEITIDHELMLRGRLEVRTGGVGLSYLPRLVSRLPTSVFILSYARCVLDMAQRRKKLQQAHNMARDALQTPAVPPKPPWKDIKA